MKKIGIITINDNNNYGNRLQNYAVAKTLSKKNFLVYTIKNRKLSFMSYSKNKIKHLLRMFLRKKYRNRYKCFKNFNKNIKYNYMSFYNNSEPTSLSKKYDYFICGSDQIWNPYFERLRKLDLLSFAESEKKISFSSSFGISKLPNEYKNEVTKELKKFKSISVREEDGKRIVEELTGREDVETLIDPTMLLSVKEWDEVAVKPKQLDNIKERKYILNYFLGELSKERKKEIERIAEENDCQIINILDKNNPFYMTGPSEFLYLEKHAFLICTDSFHSSVFAIIYDRPFIIFEREDKKEKMNSRLDTLINKFNLKDRKFNGKSITKANLNHDYTEAYKILEKEREKALKFLKKALDINE